MKKILSVATCVLIICSALPFASGKYYDKSSESDQNNLTSCHIKIEISDAEEIALLLSQKGFDILKNTITSSKLELIVNPYEFEELTILGYNPIIITKGRPFREIQAEKINLGLDVPDGYLDYYEILDELNTTESIYPDICKVYDITDKYNVSPTYEGRHIYAIKISDNVADDEDEPNFLMVSCHHAREIVAPVIAMYAIDQFTSNYGLNPVITDLVDEYEIWIAPVWNPDGYQFVFNYDNMWRKNRHPYFGEIGVDLNRNYPFGWGSGCSGSSNPYSETYKGPSPASEEETLTMIAFTQDRHFAKIIDYHSYGREVLYGYCCHSHPFSSFFQSEAISISNEAGYSGSVRSPSAEGEHFEWQIAINGSYANLMETHNEFQPSYTSAEAEAAQIWPSTIWILERPISLSGHVTDYVTGVPVEAEITLNGITFSNDEEFKSEPDFGRYHLFLPAGTYSIKFDAEYYHSKTQQVVVTSDCAEVLDVKLNRYNEPPLAPIINGYDEGIEGGQYELIVEADDPENDDLYYFVDWGDQTSGEWTGPFPAGEQVSIYHIYKSPGQYTIKAKAKDVYKDESLWSKPFTITIIENMCPTDPEIKGSNRGSPGIEYEYSFCSTDPEGHKIYYFVEWDDGSYEEWIGPYNAGEPAKVTHAWSEKDKYKIQAKAQDENSAESGWSTFNVNIPRNRFLSRNIIKIFSDRFIKIFKFFFIY